MRKNNENTNSIKANNGKISGYLSNMTIKTIANKKNNDKFLEKQRKIPIPIKKEEEREINFKNSSDYWKFYLFFKINNFF